MLELFVSPWVHNLSPFLWKFPESWGNWGPGGIRWYGLSYLAGFLTAYYLLLLAYKKQRSPYDKEQILNLMTFQILGVLLGGRIGFALLYRTEELLSDPMMIFYVWQGGMASHGGFIGVIIATFWYTRKSHQSFWPVADLIATIVPPGLFFGRLANFVNGELWGRTTEVSWGVLFPKAPDFALGIARHPSQLYAAMLEGFLVFIIVQLRFWKTNLYKRKPGRIGGEFLIIYAIARILGEFFREPDASLIMGMSRGQFYSIGLILGGITVVYWAEKRFESTR
jgi:phosphatidylglycerol:prolipoprotein diacylglycerol transferase